MLSTKPSLQSQFFGLKERKIRHVKIEDIGELYQIYEFQEEIGQGRYGKVVSVINKQTSKKWAIKVINKTDPGAKMREFKTEIRILKLVEHPNIVYLDRVYESTKKIYLVLERCIGELSSFYRERRPLPETLSKKIIKQLVSAVCYLHKNDIVHRDIKMENILMAENPFDSKDECYIKLADFGISIIKSGTGLTGMLHDWCGTPSYMSPEIFSATSYSELCDVWAIGVILYMLLYGTAPFSGANDKELQNQICIAEPVYDTSTGISPEAIHLLKLMLTKDPAYRITSTEVPNHPWLSDKTKAITSGTNLNILNVMKKWKSDLRVVPSKRSDSLLRCSNADIFDAASDNEDATNHGSRHSEKNTNVKTPLQNERRRIVKSNRAAQSYR